MSGRPDRPRAEVYEALRGRLPNEDHSHLHAVIARHGSSVLDRGVPYLLTAVRNERIDSWRRTAKELPARRVHGSSAADPAVLVAQRAELGAAIDALRLLEERDTWLLWWTAEGFSLEEIVGHWDDAGFQPVGPELSYLRVRRSRARRKLRELLQAAGYGRSND